MKENQRVVITKRMLKEGLLRLLEKKTLDEISVVELCKESGINRTTFYRHYEFPVDLLKEMQSEFEEDIRYELPKLEDKKDLTKLIAYLQDHAQLVSLFIRYNSDQEWTDMFRVLYQGMGKRETLDFMDEEDQKLFFTFLAGGTYYLLRQWLNKDSSKSSEEISTLILNILNKEILF